MPLLRYRDPSCRHSVFVSYSGADNVGSNGFVNALSDVLHQQLVGYVGAPTAKRAYTYERDPSQSGRLSKQLQAELASSYALLLVVGRQYVESSWCEYELQSFIDAYGEEGLEHRLMIAVMHADALKQVQKGELWRKHVSGSLWVPMYDEADPNEAMATRRDDDDGYRSPFFQAVRRLGNRFYRAVEAELGDDGPTGPAGWSQAKPGAMPCAGAAGAKPTGGGALKLALGPVTPDLEVEAGAVARSIEVALGSPVIRLDDDLLHDFDPEFPEVETELQRSLATVDALVMPISHARPLQPGMPGGHLFLVEQAWRRLDKPRPILWLRTGAGTPRHAEVPAFLVKHLPAIERSDALVSIEALVARLKVPEPPAVDPGGPAIRVLVEKEDVAKAYQSVTEAMNEAWQQRNWKDGVKPRLDFGPFSFSELSASAEPRLRSLPDALVVVRKLGGTDQESAWSSLQAQLEKLREGYRRAGGTDPPNILVAVICKPPPNSPPIEWPSTPLIEQDDGLMADVEDGFLNDCFKGMVRRYRRRAVERPGPASS